jgi:protein kinase-like protein
VADQDKTQLRAAASNETRPDERLPTIDGFEIKGLLGTGGMAKVYLASDVRLGRLVAIKMMSAELSSDADFRTRFENEARTVAKFRHPNIVSVYASGEVDGAKYIVMEYVDGGTLGDRLDSRNLAADDIRNIARQMADALAYSHSRGIIHRDFKPANVLFTADGMPVLSDFGVAKSTVPDGSPLTKVGIVVGTLGYMAPEQALGSEIDERIDIYSLGVVLFEMLKGELPPRLGSDDKEKTVIRSELRDARPELVDLVCRCVDRDPAKRPSAEQCRQALESLAPSAAPATSSRRVAIIAGAGLVVAGVAAAILLSGLQPSSSSDTPAGSRTAGDPLAFPPVQYSFDVEPAEALLYVDGSRLDARTAELLPGGHGVAAVATGYYGQIQTIQADALAPTLRIVLQPIVLPTQEELTRFVAALEAPRVMPAELQSVRDPALQQVLLLKQLRETARLDELAKLERDLDTLASYDDAAAVVTLYLAAEGKTLDRDAGSLVPRLQAAMDSGYALATFWFAIRLRDALTSVRFAATDPSYRLYCNTMALASEQGLEAIAGRYLQDDCQALR